MLIGILEGKDKREVLAAQFVPTGVDWEDEPFTGAVATVAAGSFSSKSRDQIRASGYVVHTLEAALWAFHHGDNFRDGACLR